MHLRLGNPKLSEQIFKFITYIFILYCLKVWVWLKHVLKDALCSQRLYPFDVKIR